MFLGHFALGFAAKKVDAGVSLATGFAAAQLADVVWPVLVLSGVERVAIAPGDTAVTPLRFESYPYSHSLVALAVWGAALGASHYLSRRRARAAVLLALLVLSHWVLAIIYLAAFFGPPPLSVEAVALSGVLGAVILMPWAAWVDRHRSPR